MRGVTSPQWAIGTGECRGAKDEHGGAAEQRDPREGPWAYRIVAMLVTLLVLGDDKLICVDGDAAADTERVATVTGADPSGTPVSDEDDARVAPFAVGGTGSIGDLVWNDRNGNQVQDPGEPGIAGARVRVTEVDSGVGREYVTDATGFYSATGLIGATYRAEIITASVDGSLTTVASYTVVLADGEHYEQADFGVRVLVANQLSATGLELGQRLAIALAALAAGVVLVRLAASRRRRPTRA